MNRIRGRWGVGGVLWMAAASVGALAGAAPAAGADAAAVSVVEQSARPATEPQTGAQAQATPAVPERAASQEEQFQHPVTEQQAASATVSNPQIFAGPGGFSFQSPDGGHQIRFHGEFDFDGRFYND